MTQAQKIKDHINDKNIYRISTLSRIAKIDRLHLHLFLRADKKLKDDEIVRLSKLLKENQLK